MRKAMFLSLGISLALLCACNTQSTQASTGTSAASGFTGFFRPKTVTLPAGAVLQVRTESALSTNSQASGDHFQASLDAPVSIDGKVVLPAGATVDGIIVSADKGGRVKGVASMALKLTAVRSGSKAIDIDTAPVTFHARTRRGKDAATVGIGSGVGAAIGAIAGGGAGAAIGAAAGAGAGTGVVLGTRGDPVRIAPETRISFTLKEAVTIPAS